MNLISCKDYVENKKVELKDCVSKLPFKPCLAVVQVDSVAASNTYVKSKKKDAMELGISFVHVPIDSENCTQEEFESILNGLNNLNTVNGIIIQLPIPDKYDLKKLQRCISSEKDVDGFRVDSCFKPCTPKGIMDWLKFNNYKFSGKNAVVIGRSNIVGKPLVNMLIEEGATVTCCNSKTKDLWVYTKRADLVASAIGSPKFFDAYYFSYMNDVVIDVGINRDNFGKLCGDINKDELFEAYGNGVYVTPVPGGVGLLTRVALMENVIKAYEIQNKMEVKT